MSQFKPKSGAFAHVTKRSPVWTPLSTCAVVVTAGSSTDVSEDWEKDFDLDMTEEEVQMALSKIESSGEVICLFSYFAAL